MSKTLILGYILCFLAPYISFFFFPPNILKDMWLLIHKAEIEPTPPGLKEWSLNHWTTKEIHILFFMRSFTYLQKYTLSHQC